MSTAKHVAELIDALAKMRIENHELRLDERRWRNARDIWDGMNKQKGVKIGELEAENLALRIEREKLKEMVARYVDIGAVEREHKEEAIKWCRAVVETVADQLPRQIIPLPTGSAGDW